jgi:hypothetical protein
MSLKNAGEGVQKPLEESSAIKEGWGGHSHSIAEAPWREDVPGSLPQQLDFYRRLGKGPPKQVWRVTCGILSLENEELSTKD